MSAIESCRTAALGGHVMRCEDCLHTQIAYNSCRNRHCPKCQGSQALAWMKQRKSELLDVPYFHVVFTLPGRIAAIAYQNKAVVYDLLFKASSQTMRTIAADPKHLGVKIGFTSVLHTWGSAMTHHPHVHMIVPGGGLSMDGSRWVAAKPRFFLPGRVLPRRPPPGGRHQAEILPARARPVGPVPSADAGEAPGSPRRGKAAVLRPPRASGQCEGIPALPGSAQKEALVHLRQAPLRGSQGRARLSVP